VLGAYTDNAFALTAAACVEFLALFLSRFEFVTTFLIELKAVRTLSHVARAVGGDPRVHDDGAGAAGRRHLRGGAGHERRVLDRVPVGAGRGGDGADRAGPADLRLLHARDQRARRGAPAWLEAWALFGSQCSSRMSIRSLSALVKIFDSVPPTRFASFQRELFAPFLALTRETRSESLALRVLDWLAGVLKQRDLDLAWPDVIELLQICASKVEAVRLRAFLLVEEYLSLIPVCGDLIKLLFSFLTTSQTNDTRAHAIATLASFAPAETWVVRELCDALGGSVDPVVETLGANLLCRLLAQLRDPDSFVNTVSPLLASCGPHLQAELVREVFRSLIPAWPDAAAFVAPLVALVTEMRTQAVVAVLLGELTHYAQAECGDAVTPLLTAIEGLDRSEQGLKLLDAVAALDSAPLLERCLELALVWEAPDAIAATWRRLLRVESARRAELTVALAKYAASRGSAVVARALSDGLEDPEALALLAPKRFEFQDAIFDFYLIDAPKLRQLGRTLAIMSQRLFQG
jgi:hypothetical protein